MDLTALSQTTRKAVILGGLGLIALIVIRFAFIILLAVIHNLTPAKPPAANQFFGQIAPIKFTQPSISSSKFSYTLDTVDSKLPEMPSIFTVYQLRTPPTLFLSLDAAKKRAAQFGFNEEPTAQSANIYQWSDTDLLGYNFTLDVGTGDFQIKADPAKVTNVVSDKLSFDENEAITQAKNYLKNHTALTSLFEKGEAKVKFVNITSNGANEVNAASAGNGFQVDLYPANIDDKYQVLDQTPTTGVISITLVNTKDNNLFPFDINYKQLEIDTESKGTYNIISSTQAWDQFNKGSGIVIKSSTPSGSIAINNISIGYFVEENSKYLKPVYIFEGTSSPQETEPDFVGILPAIGSPDKTQ